MFEPVPGASAAWSGQVTTVRLAVARLGWSALPSKVDASSRARSVAECGSGVVTDPLPHWDGPLQFPYPR